MLIHWHSEGKMAQSDEPTLLTYCCILLHQTLVEVIRKCHKHSHLHEILTEVVRRTVDIAVGNELVGRNVQIPTFLSTLRRPMFL